MSVLADIFVFALLQVATLTAERDSMASQNMTLASTTSKLMAATAGGSNLQNAEGSGPGSIGSFNTALNGSSTGGRSSGHAAAASAAEGSSDKAPRGGAVLTAAQVGEMECRCCVICELG